MAYNMNPQRGAHMQAGQESGDVEQESGQHHAPHIHFHPHHDEQGNHTHTTVHVMHHDGTHTKHDHAAGDTEGMAAHIHKHMGGAEGQDHGYSSGEEMENETGYGPGV
jgi:hypothetical protein